MSTTYQITRAAELETLGVFRQFIAEKGQAHQLESETVFELQLAMDEACTNIIQHGYAGMNPGSIILEMQVGVEAVILQITDYGQAFEPSSAPQPDIEAALEDRPIGGFGLFFIYSTMDEVDYYSSGPQNTLILKKKIS